MKHTAGLTTSEAKKRLEMFGANEIVGKPRQTTLQIFISQFTSLLIVLLTLAALASLFLGDLLDGVFILLIVLLNGILGFVQEYKAEKTIAALKKMTTSSVRVIRDGTEQKIDSKELVPGDMLLLEEGDKVPADMRVLESSHMEVSEAALTGESLPIEKNAHTIGQNELFMGTIVVHGRATGEVQTTGMNTRFGSIAATLATMEDEETPLQKKLDVLGKQLSGLAVLASIVVFGIGFAQRIPAIEMMLTSISLAVAAVPEGLPAVITITLALGMQKMARQKALLRKLSAIESLGSTTVIATDKTGTLTKNQMRVVDMWLVTDTKESMQTLLEAGVICNNANVSGKTILGDTTEGALILLAADKGNEPQQIRENGQRREEFSFDPTLKLMSVVWDDNKKIIIYTKGAPESVLAKTTLSPASRKKVEAKFHNFAKRGLRVIALAYKETKQVPLLRTQAEKDLIFLGLVGIADPPREEVKEAIAVAKRAGIRTIMITGDNELTAHAIGKTIGLVGDKQEILTGLQFGVLSDEEVIQKLDTIAIFARTSPDQKLRIIKLLQRQGHIVAVTGDGVNDALALKQSNVGVAMGITGTDVAKEAADMIITDDNYATLVSAIAQGRTVFDNIKSSVKYLVGCNIGEVLAVVAGMLLGWPLILTPLQLLYINLVTDGLPAIALAVNPLHEGVMKRKPIKGKNMFGGRDITWFIEVSALTTFATIVAFWIGQMSGNLALARALAFTTMILVQHFILLDVWTRESSLFKKNILNNRVFLFAFFVPLLIQPLLLYIPILSQLFKIAPVSLVQLGWMVGLSSVVLLSSELRKFVRKPI